MLNLGIIGLSEANGHPYSWSAIINGDYDEKTMAECGFAVIPAYLAANRDTLGIEQAKVTHIWTQDGKLSAHVAKASHIENVVEKIEDMVGQVDAVLLARDDPENHVAMAKPFIEADIPIFIDKPLALCREDLQYFIEQQEAGKFIMSCSALRYSAGNQAARAELSSLGNIELAVAIGKKCWRKYAIHYLEGLFSLLGDPKVKSIQNSGKNDKNIVYIEFENGIMATVHVFADIADKSELIICGQNDFLEVNHGGAYTAFRNQLVEVIRSFEQGKPRLEFEKTRNVISALIAGKESLEQGGKRIELK